MDMVFQVAPDEVRQAAAPPAKDQDHEELDEHAETGQYAVHGGNDPDQDAVHDTDQELDPPGTQFVDKQLFLAFTGGFHADHSSVRPLPH